MVRVLKDDPRVVLEGAVEVSRKGLIELAQLVEREQPVLDGEPPQHVDIVVSRNPNDRTAHRLAFVVHTPTIAGGTGSEAPITARNNADAWPGTPVRSSSRCPETFTPCGG